MRLRDLPNAISVLRIFLVLPIVYFLLQEQYDKALVLFFVAGVSDGLDGFLAKRFNWTSRWGSILDPAADKILLVSSYFVLSWLGHIPIWLTAVVIGRDVVILGGAIAYHFAVGAYEMEPRFLSKANTFMQIVLGLAVVMGLSIFTLEQWAVDLLVYSVLVTSVLSGTEYVWLWGRRAINAKTISKS